MKKGKSTHKSFHASYRVMHTCVIHFFNGPFHLFGQNLFTYMNGYQILLF